MQGRGVDRAGVGVNRGGGYDWGPAIGMGAGMLGRGIYDLFGNKGTSPSEAAMPYYEQIIRQLPRYFEPYMGAGAQAVPNLQQQYNALLGDPGAMYNRFGAGYKESPGYQFRQRQGQEAALNAAAAGGMAGSPMHQQNAAQVSEDIANQDFMNYLQSIMGLYGTGLGGEEQLAKTGALASMGLGEDLARALMSQANLSYTGALRNQQSNEGMWGNILGGLGTVAGAIYGGPGGAAAGGGLGNLIGSWF